MPAAVIVLGAGSGTGAGLKLGHFAAMRWRHADAAREVGSTLPEVFIGGEGLARGPEDVLATLPWHGSWHEMWLCGGAS